MVRISRQCDRGEHRAVDADDLPGCTERFCRCTCHPRAHPSRSGLRPLIAMRGSHQPPTA